MIGEGRNMFTVRPGKTQSDVFWTWTFKSTVGVGLLWVGLVRSCLRAFSIFLHLRSGVGKRWTRDLDLFRSSSWGLLASWLRLVFCTCVCMGFQIDRQSHLVGSA